MPCVSFTPKCREVFGNATAFRRFVVQAALDLDCAEPSFLRALMAFLGSGCSGCTNSRPLVKRPEDHRRSDELLIRLKIVVPFNGKNLTED